MTTRDINKAAAETTICKATPDWKPMPRDIEEAWEVWSKPIQGVDERSSLLLRAAFDAGVVAGTKAFAASGGRAGGKARAEKLTPGERKAIAQKAARKRWGGD